LHGGLKASGCHSREIPGPWPPFAACAAVQLLDDGATVPFVARYRKEAAGGLDDTQLRTPAERLDDLRE
jgi:uncharacterized protein